MLISKKTGSPEGAKDRTFPPYTPEKGTRDEAISEGEVRPEWGEFFRTCEAEGVGILRQWQRETARISRERGLAYDSERVGVGWQLDPIPWIIGESDWGSVEAGVAQRMRLYDLLFRDLYGPQICLKQGWLPAEVVLQHRGMIRSLRGSFQLPVNWGLGISGFDLVRTGGGDWVFLNDRFDSTFGLGLALENRTVINQVLPDLFRRNQVRLIGHFFHDWFHYLGECVNTGGEEPRVVILDSHNEGSSESRFLANYCGVPRVVPSDLTVRDNRVWLKCLSGLEPVHAIWRNGGEGCRIDPLGVPGTFPGGIPGCFHSMLAGNVALLSQPGSGVLHSPGIHPFLPRLYRELLGEEPVLPTVRSWWAGDAASLSFILDNLSHLVVKKVEWDPEFETQYGRLCSRKELNRLRQRIREEPGRFVAQEELDISTAPTSDRDSLSARRIVMRAFAFLDAGGAPRIMPGGMGRVGNADGEFVSTRAGGQSKDIWVRSTKPDTPILISTAVENSPIRGGDVVTSRSAENLYWAGRYAERTDAIARLASRLIESAVLGFTYGRELESQHETILIRALFDVFQMGSFLDPLVDSEHQIQLLLKAEGDCPLTIGTNLQRFEQACLGAREKWSPRSLLAIQKIVEEWESGLDRLITPYSYRPKLERLGLNLAAFVGLNLDSMTRDEGWALLDSGRAIERCEMLAGLVGLLLRSEIDGAGETLLCESVLFATDSLRTYQSRYVSVPRTGLAVRLLFAEDDYPRSIQFLVNRLWRNSRKLSPVPSRDRVWETVDTLQQALRTFLPESGEPEGPFDAGLLDRIVFLLRELNDELTKAYFSHTAGDA